MNLHITKKLHDKLKIDLQPEQPCDELFTWRANYAQGHGFRFVVFMNDASRLTVVINEAKADRLKKLSELFLENLRATLLALCINPEIVDLYMGDLGEVSYVKNSGRQKTAWLNKCTDNAWFALRDLTE